MIKYKKNRAWSWSIMVLGYLMGISLVGATGVVPPLPVDLYVGEVHIISMDQLKRIAIGNGKIIKATPLDGGQVLVIPEAPGQSSLYLWDRKGGERNYAIRVVPADANHLLHEIRTMIGTDTKIRTRIVGDKVVLEGEDISDEQAVRLEEIAKRYPQIVNLISRVGLERMIEMDVQLLEVRRNALEQVGFKWNNLIQGPLFGVLAGSNPMAEGAAILNAGAPGAYWNLAASIQASIDLLVQKGEATVLAKPKLSCRSGGSAHFVAGGELPIPFTSGLAGVSVGFKEYGVKFDIHPTVSQSDLIAVKLAVEVSSINFEVQVQAVPGLNKRRAETEVNLHEHETFVIAGLLNQDASRAIDKLPVLGDLPILGPLFRSRQFQERRSDLVILITPRFVLGALPEAQAETPPLQKELEALQEELHQ